MYRYGRSAVRAAGPAFCSGHTCATPGHTCHTSWARCPNGRPPTAAAHPSLGPAEPGQDAGRSHRCGFVLLCRVEIQTVEYFVDGDLDASVDVVGHPGSPRVGPLVLLLHVGELVGLVAGQPVRFASTAGMRRLCPKLIPITRQAKHVDAPDLDRPKPPRPRRVV